MVNFFDNTNDFDKNNLFDYADRYENMNDNYINGFGFINITQPILNDDIIPISNICFPKHTQIQTDQGIINIENININIHTIQRKKILKITKTITQDKYLICFYKNSLGINYPNKDTIMSKDHKIYFMGKMIESYKFMNIFENVKKIKYNGEILYNILMENYEKINVNNLICETLHPENIIAKLYTSKLNKKYINNILLMCNEFIIKNDYKSYKKIINEFCFLNKIKYCKK